MSEQLAAMALGIRKNHGSPGGRRALLHASLALVLLSGLAACSVENAEDEPVAGVANGLTGPDAPANAHLLVLVRSDKGAFTVVSSRRVDGPLPKRRGETKQAGWSFRAAGPAGVPAHQGILDNPHTLRGDFKDAVTGDTQGVAITRAAAATFAVRVPLGTNLVEFFDQRLPADAAAAAAGAKAAANTPAGAVRLGSVALP